jgi:hypothetical protein
LFYRIPSLRPPYLSVATYAAITGQIHVRHLGVRVEEERHQAILIEVRPFGDFLEWRGVGVRLALRAGDHMAGRAPALRQSFTVERIGGERLCASERHSNSIQPPRSAGWPRRRSGEYQRVRKYRPGPTSIGAGTGGAEPSAGIGVRWITG